MGQISLVISSGAQGFQGQTTGQTMEYGRRGVEISQIGGLGPTGVDGNHHQRVVFGTDLLVQGSDAPCKCF